MKKIFNIHKTILVSILVIGLAWIGYFIFSSLAFPQTKQTFLKDGKAKLYPEKEVTQKFTATDNGLSQINFALQNANLSFGDIISLELKDGNCLGIIKKDEIGFFTSKSQIYDKFKFSRIEDSQNKTYCFAITYEPKNKKNGDYPFLLISESEEFKGFSYFNSENNKEYKDRSIIMKPAYSEESTLKSASELINRMSQYKPWFFKDAYLITIIIIFTLASLCLATILILL